MSANDGLELQGFRFQSATCCFCGTPITPAEVDPIWLIARAHPDQPGADDFGTFTRWCHVACFNKLTEYPLVPDDDAEAQ